MKHLSTFPILAWLLIQAACVNDPQDLPNPAVYQPEFFASMELGQEVIDFTAGEGGYVMYTEHHTDAEGVTRYISRFAPDSCKQISCRVLEIEFIDNQQAMQPGSGVQYTFQPGLKEYYNTALEGDLELTFFLGQDQIEPGVSYWTQGMDTLTQISSNQVMFYTGAHTFVDLCYHRNGTDHCAGTATYCFHSLASSPLIGVLKADRTFGEYILIEMDVQGTPPYQYTWMTGGTNSFILLPAQDGVVDVDVTVTDATLSTITVSQKVVISNGDAEMCGGKPGFAYSIAKEPFTQFATVIIRYTDTEGRVFSTSYGDQTGSSFEILQVHDFGLNPQNFNTKKIILFAQGVMYTADGSFSQSFKGEDIAIAVSYDE